jgi:GNAT superfamily N-acetyltransferase
MVDTLVGAFQSDPVFEWMLPEQTERETMVPALFNVWVDAYLRHESFVIGEGGVEGVALWAPPGVDAMEDDDNAALEALAGAMSPESVERMITVTSMFDSTHPHDEPLWYLHFLGTQPDHQGKGHGSMLLRRVLDRADELGQPAYLDATSARNRALYERHGFVCIAEHRLPDGPTTSAMWREPRT